MRSHTSASRRCSELSQASSLGGGGLRMQSPWDPTAAANSSRRASDAAGARASPVMSHHLSRLHKKAVAAGTNTPSSSLVQVNKKREKRRRHLEPSSVGMVRVILNRHRLAVYRYLCSRLAAHGKLIFYRFIYSVTKSCYKNVHKSIYRTSIVPYLFLFFGYYFTLLTIFLTNSLIFPSLDLHNVDNNLVLLAGCPETQFRFFSPSYC
jgi:hypothetical protein